MDRPLTAAVCLAVGLLGTPSNPADLDTLMSRVLERLERGELAGQSATQEMRQVLRRQFYASRLPQRIRFLAAVGHKTGDWPPLSGSDVGIIYSPNGPIVISVFTNANRGDFFELEAATPTSPAATPAPLAPDESASGPTVTG